MALRDARHVATCVDFGPRFLHSTGQAYKGGPDSGVFLQITADDAEDLPVPGQTASFGVIKAAQARGDFDVLTERRRRALRVHIKGDLAGGLKSLDAAISKAITNRDEVLMQLGMIGLGRMGGNIVRRLIQNGHHAVVYDKDPHAVATSGQRGRASRLLAGRFCQQAHGAARGLGDAAGRADHRKHHRSARQAAVAR